MPRTEIDYSNTIIYKIICKDSNVKDLYVGHTTNFVQRKHAHKQSCLNEKSPNYSLKLYKTIRENGGWINWSMEIINFFKCNDHFEARVKEQEYFTLLNATLNSIEPMPKPKDHVIKNEKSFEDKQEYLCHCCNVKFQNSKLMDIHNNTAKHLKLLDEKKMPDTNKILTKNASKFMCEICNFKCFKESNYNIHLLTDKHKKRIVSLQEKTHLELDSLMKYKCLCGKKYKHMSSLCNHKKTCDGIKKLQTEQNAVISETNEKIDHKSLIQELMKQNNEFKTMLIEQNTKIMELAKEGKYITNNNNTTNNNNFNLNFFLNEQCKDALNIMDFINQLQLNTTDLDMVGRLGYSEGISKLFIRGLKELDVFKRPIHCSDLKREVLYVKDKDSWEKDNEEKNKMKTAIKYIAAKNFKQINEWRAKNPESDDYDSQRHMDYHQIVIHSMGGSTKEEDEKHYNKIIKNVAQEVTIDKNTKQLA